MQQVRTVLRIYVHKLKHLALVLYSGHEYFYCLVLEQSSHIGYCWDNKNEQYAQDGAALLAQSHVNIEPV